MVCKRQEQCVFGEKCIYHIGSVLPKCSIFEQKPPIKQTEQEYIQTCTTEQLAEELLAWWFDGANTYSHFGLFQSEIDEAKEKITKWLKQQHTTRSKNA